MTLKTKIIIVVAVILLIIAYFYFRPAKVTTTAITAPDAAPKPVSNDNFPINVGSQGPNVKRLQMALNRIKPTSSIAEDGAFGPLTRVKLLTTVSTQLSALPMNEATLIKIIALGNRAV